VCRQQLERRRPSPEALLLLGVLEQAHGHLERAAVAWRQALYLDPHHLEALLHLCLLMKQLGQTELAARLERRLARLKARHLMLAE